jgi:hypothetical protein|tara:strand:+ start:875 stop:1096 length:222 start_codon:yes stop_codon:yes gene_type:complete
VAKIDNIGLLKKLYKVVDKKRTQFNKKFSLEKVNFDVDMHNVKNQTNIPKPFGGKTEYDLKAKAANKKNNKAR